MNVTCGGDTDKLEMKICFKPNEHVDFSDGWKMFAEDQSDHDECVAHTVDDQHPETTWCDDGMQALAINMNPTNGAENGAKCGTEMIEAVSAREFHLSSILYETITTRATLSIARSLPPCGVRLSVCPSVTRR